MTTAIDVEEFTQKEINEFADSAISGGLLHEESASPDEWFTNKLFKGEEPPKTWGEWPEIAKKQALLFGRVYIARYREKGNRKVTAEEMWDAVRASAEVDNRTRRLTWADIGSRLGGVGAYEAAEQARSLGFDVGGGFQNKKIFSGPCLECGEATTQRVCEECEQGV